MRIRKVLAVVVTVMAASHAVAAGHDAALLERGTDLMNGVVACGNCHVQRGANGEPLFDKGMLVHGRLGAGGQVFKGPWGESVSRNLTPHPSGLKDWSDAQIITAVRDGVDRNGKPYRPPMGYGFYKSISDADMAALVTYLRSLKPQPFAGK